MKLTPLLAACKRADEVETEQALQKLKDRLAAVFGKEHLDEFTFSGRCAQLGEWSFSVGYDNELWIWMSGGMLGMSYLKINTAAEFWRLFSAHKRSPAGSAVPSAAPPGWPGPSPLGSL